MRNPLQVPITEMTQKVKKVSIKKITLLGNDFLLHHAAPEFTTRCSSCVQTPSRGTCFGAHLHVTLPLSYQPAAQLELSTRERTAATLSPHRRRCSPRFSRPRTASALLAALLLHLSASGRRRYPNLRCAANTGLTAAANTSAPPQRRSSMTPKSGKKARGGTAHRHALCDRGRSASSALPRTLRERERLHGRCPRNAPEPSGATPATLTCPAAPVASPNMEERDALPEGKVLLSAPPAPRKTTLPMVPRARPVGRAVGSVAPAPWERRDRWRCALRLRWRLCCSRSWSGPSSPSCPSRCRGSWSVSSQTSRARSMG